MAEYTANLNRDYLDNTAVKDYAENVLIPEFFPDIDPSLRTIGMIGYTTEIITNYGEDSFNGASVLFRESFVNRAQLSESIYSHAALFQIDNLFATAASCRFLMVLEEEAIINNMEPASSSSILGVSSSSQYKFWIDRDTQIFVEDRVFSLDYDIEITIVKKNSTEKEEYLFTANYDMKYKNSISTVTDPYVKVRRSSDGYLALEVYTHQIERLSDTENLVSSNLINYPVIDINFDGMLAGFDVIYRTPTGSTQLEVLGVSTTGECQLDTRILYSQATKLPFCYFQMLDSDTLRLSFNANDNYFIPEYGSQIEYTLYLTDGEYGNFDTYNGDDISLLPATERFDYSNTYLTAARPIGASVDGASEMGMEGLQSLAEEGYRTALALTTDQDLKEYFSNYKYRYGNAEILFIKKRNDIAERVHSAFVMMKDGDYIYNTNTLSLDINLYDLKYDELIEKNIFILEPGTLFTCKKSGWAEFYYDTVKYDNYHGEYENILALIDYPYQKRVDHQETDDIWLFPVYGQAPPGKEDMVVSYGEWKHRKGYNDELTIFDVTKDFIDYYDDPIARPDPSFIFINPFLTRFKKNPNTVSHYLTYVQNASFLDFTKQDEDAYVQFIGYVLNVNREFSAEKKYTLSFSCTSSVNIEENYPPLKVMSDEGISEDRVYNVGDKYHTELNDLRVFVVIEDKSKNVCMTELYPKSYSTDDYVLTFENDIFTDDHITNNGFLRLLEGDRYIHDVYKINAIRMVYDNIEGDKPDTFEEYLASYGDAISYIQYLDLSEEDYKKECVYYEPHENDRTLFYEKYMYDWDETKVDERGIEYIEHHYAGTITDASRANISVNEITRMKSEGTIYFWKNVKSLTTTTEVYIPFEDVVCKVITVYNRYLESDGILAPITDRYLDQYPNVGNYLYVTYEGNERVVDKALRYYNDTNEYRTVTSPITFIKPLNNVRTTLTFKDYMSKVIDGNRVIDGVPAEVFINKPMDVTFKNIPFLRAATVYNEERFKLFLNSFYAQYEALTGIIPERLRQETSIDIKFYNTYGFSKYFVIGEESQILDVVNLALDFDIWYVQGTDPIVANQEVKAFIKQSVETINANQMNNLYISNLMRKIELAFSYVDHIRFNHINEYDTEYQAVKNYAIDIDHDLTTEERREYVPEFLVVDLDDIKLTEYFVD